MTYYVVVKGKAESEVKKLPENYQRRALELFHDLASDPVPRTGYDIVRMEGRVDVFRIRIGNIRIVYQVDWSRKLVIILRVAARGHVY
jgi:mRNA interferase RelE/StbE